MLLLHEKPVAGIDGAGQHCHWGLNTDTGKETCTFLGRRDALRASIGNAGDDHKLGAQEAPIANISLGTGESMENT